MFTTGIDYFPHYTPTLDIPHDFCVLLVDAGAAQQDICILRVRAKNPRWLRVEVKRCECRKLLL
jgi:hypothetical protein